MVTLTIDNRTVTVPEGTTILEAARTARIEIPTMCYLKEINEIGACRLCIVEVEGQERLIPSCNNVPIWLHPARRLVRPAVQLWHTAV